MKFLIVMTLLISGAFANHHEYSFDSAVSAREMIQNTVFITHYVTSSSEDNPAAARVTCFRKSVFTKKTHLMLEITKKKRYFDELNNFMASKVFATPDACLTELRKFLNATADEPVNVEITGKNTFEFF